MKTERFEALDAWRGICALLVALEHILVTSALHDNLFIHHAYRFVDFFFVLSGFVIMHSYRIRLTQGWAQVRTFLIRRIGRLWPLHVVMLLAFIGFELCIALAARLDLPTGRAAFSDRTSFDLIPAHLLLIHSWGITDQLTWNGPSWSISTEFFAYTLFALLCAILPSRWLVAFAAMFIAGAAALLIVAAPLEMQSTFDFGLPRCIFGFMTGVLTHRLWERKQVGFGTTGEMGAVGLVFASVTLLPHDAWSLLVTPIFGLTVWIFAAEDGAISARLRTRLPQQLGAWSYSIYMVHSLIVLCLLSLAMIATKFGFPLLGRVDGAPTIVGSEAVTLPITVAYLAIVLVISRFTYLHVELRGQRWFGTLAGVWSGGDRTAWK